MLTQTWKLDRGHAQCCKCKLTNSDSCIVRTKQNKKSSKSIKFNQKIKINK